MGCNHSYVYTPEYFVCTSCGKKSYRRSQRRQSGKKVAALLTITIVMCTIIIVFGYSNEIIKIDQEKLEQIIQEITDFVTIHIPDSTITTISKIEFPDSIDDIINNSTYPISQIEIPDVSTLPVRLKSEFNPSLIEEHIYNFTNDERQQRGIEKLTRISEIDSIARDHSWDMSDRDYFSHYSPEGEDSTDRGNKAGYSCKKEYLSYYTEGLAENIYQSHTYYSYTTVGIAIFYNWIADEKTLAKELVDGWMDSPGHRENILDEEYDRIGVGVIINGGEGVYSTQNFC